MGEVTLRVRHGGRGPAVVLLHGHPRTHTTWHRVAPQLACALYVVCSDLRGYGQSTLPADAPEHAQSSKRAMAGDVVALMRHLDGMCEDYRAGLRIDREHERADRAAGRQVACPTLLLAATEDDIDIHGDPQAIRRPWVAGELRSAPIHSGHHQAEQAPDQLRQALLEFLAPPTR